MNARDEFIEFTKDKPKIICAVLEDVNYASETRGKKWILYEAYSTQEYDSFLKSLNFDYDDGYGSQELGGTIWFEDGTFASRGEYDGSEWWEYHKAPEKPVRPLKDSTL